MVRCGENCSVGKPLPLTGERPYLPAGYLGLRGRDGRFATPSIRGPNKVLYRLCQDVDLAFLDGMFVRASRGSIGEEHITADDAARVAARAGARRAVLVHISPRYTEGDMEKFVDAAKKRFGNTEIGTDLQQFTIPYREDDP